VLAGVEDDLVRPVSQREREGSRLYELGAVADDRKDSHSDREFRCSAVNRKHSQLVAETQLRIAAPSLARTSCTGFARSRRPAWSRPSLASTSINDRTSRPMPLKILLAGAPLLVRGVMTGKTLVWYVNWRLERV
jgi:hypothetical protein